METIDLNILQKLPEISSQVKIQILPLAPLSMTTGVAGSYYKADFEPSKKMLCGLFENFLGWHFSALDRKEIAANLKKIRKKHKSMLTEVFPGSNYQPLLWDYFEVVAIESPQFESYDDYWNRAYRRADAINHANGTFQASYEAVIAKSLLPRDAEGKLETTPYEKYFVANVGLWPLYYSSPTQREFIYPSHGQESTAYSVLIDIDPALAGLLQKAEGEPCYLGTSEGWVDLKIELL